MGDDDDDDPWIHLICQFLCSCDKNFLFSNEWNKSLAVIVFHSFIKKVWRCYIAVVYGCRFVYEANFSIIHSCMGAKIHIIIGHNVCKYTSVNKFLPLFIKV